MTPGDSRHRAERRIDDLSETTRIVETTVEAVAAATDRRPTAVTEPLYDAVDPEATSRLLAPATRCAVEFSFDGCRVRIEADGTVTAQPARTTSRGGNATDTPT
ncbi:HalOD1 output domain-containing protein [Haloarcula litorea]|uniref:HalOD1 output domain-containing protein n=1 Tax=Haloarcula litorea TaxID=3032579 RepID=UPI0023E8C031|nr:HalOD1 output domain-containing protein [Halomicroarcula sp. GDY20]